jgi:hypothetical protein
MARPNLQSSALANQLVGAMRSLLGGVAPCQPRLDVDGRHDRVV